MKGVMIVYRFAIPLAALALAACSTTGLKTAQGDDLSNRLAQVEERETAVDKQEAQLANRQQELAQQQSEIEQQLQMARAAEARAAEAKALAAKQPAEEMGMMEPSLLPPQASPGQCFARVFAPPTYETVTQKVLKQEASQRIKIIPAQFATETEQVMVAAPSERLEIIPAQFAMVEEKVLVKPAASRLVETPARYAKTSEKILVRPAHQVWQKGAGPVQRIDEATGEIMCLVDVPAEYRTVTKTVLQEAASTKLIEEPAVYKTVQKQVMSQPPQTKVVQIPAKFKTITVTKLVTPARKNIIEIPATYQTVSKQVKVSEGQLEWREILCRTNMTPERISDIQSALLQQGFNPGPIDGVIGPKTIAAVNNFQQKNQLPVDKYLNVATLKALGISPR
jgi:hypothetical protein